MPSTVVSNFHYNKKTQTLQIIFVTGMVYDYKNVPEDVYLKMKESFSKGTYFNQYIKNVYEFVKFESN